MINDMITAELDPIDEVVNKPNKLIPYQTFLLIYLSE